MFRLKNEHDNVRDNRAAGDVEFVGADKIAKLSAETSLDPAPAASCSSHCYTANGHQKQKTKAPPPVARAISPRTRKNNDDAPTSCLATFKQKYPITKKNPAMTAPAAPPSPCFWTAAKNKQPKVKQQNNPKSCLLYTSPSPRD